MASDPNPALRAAITADRDALGPQIRGLRALASIDAISEDLRNAFSAAADARQFRSDVDQQVLHLLDEVINAVTRLEQMGYPALPDTEIMAGLLAELQRQMADLQAGASVFGLLPQVTALSLSFGEPQPKTPTP